MLLKPIAKFVFDNQSSIKICINEYLSKRKKNLSTRKKETYTRWKYLNLDLQFLISKTFGLCHELFCVKYFLGMARPKTEIGAWNKILVSFQICQY